MGDGVRTTFALAKAYGDYARPIVKPVVGSVVVAIDGAPLAPSGYAVADTTGIVALVSPPAAGVVVTAGFVFDTPVRFDIDRLDLAVDGFGAGHAVAVPLVEVRL